jgi:hypothetical protein
VTTPGHARHGAELLEGRGRFHLGHPPKFGTMAGVQSDDEYDPSIRLSFQKNTMQVLVKLLARFFQSPLVSALSLASPSLPRTRHSFQ